MFQSFRWKRYSWMSVKKSSVAVAGAFTSTRQIEKAEIHPVFLAFPSLYLV